MTVTTSTEQGRRKILWPDFDHEGGSGLHTKITDSVAQISNDQVGSYHNLGNFIVGEKKTIVHNHGVVYTSLNYIFLQASVVLENKVRGVNFAITQDVDSNTIEVENISGVVQNNIELYLSVGNLADEIANNLSFAINGGNTYYVGTGFNHYTLDEAITKANAASGRKQIILVEDVTVSTNITFPGGTTISGVNNAVIFMTGATPQITWGSGTVVRDITFYVQPSASTSIGSLLFVPEANEYCAFRNGRVWILGTNVTAMTTLLELQGDWANFDFIYRPIAAGAGILVPAITIADTSTSLGSTYEIGYGV